MTFLKHTWVFLLLCLGNLAYSNTLPADLKWQSNESAPIWAAENVKKGGIFTDYILSFPPTLRTVGPDSNSSFRRFINANQIGLVGIHPNTEEIIPALAQKWAYDDDGKTVYYQINADAKWSDGHAVTADDFLYTLEFMRSPHINAPWYNNYYTEQIINVKKYSDLVISITGAVERPKDELHYYYGVNPTPKHFYKTLNENWVKDFNWKVVPNTGPYQIGKISNGKQITFDRKPNWWGNNLKYNQGRFNVDKVIFKVIRDVNIAYNHFEKGNIDTFSLVQPEFWHNKATGSLYDKGLIEKVLFYNDMPRSSSGVFLNQDHEILKDKDVRFALAHAMNFDKVIQTVLRDDYERLQSFHTGYGKYSNQNIKARSFDLTKANDILDNSNWSERDGKGIRTKDGKRLSLNLVYGRKEHTERWAIIKQDALKAGIEINLVLQDSSSHYKTIMQKQHDMTSLGWSTGFRPAYWQHFHSENAHKPQTNNVTNMDNPEIDKLIMSYRSAIDTPTRIKLANQLEGKIHDSGAFIPDYKVPYTRGAHWRWIKFPNVPGTKTTSNLYSPFGNGGIFWVDNQIKIETKSARKSKTKYPVVNKVYEQFRVSTGE
ncbi:extracellular solute-binding protein [Oceaniserpentilla sp. 4NH20-0058]|uniref:extracellular solute-binding protein n=1 Tax=Oceaniserpentilla sp. 4NH20-0058 TaxID=3127660 RepID=UPI003106A51F